METETLAEALILGLLEGLTEFIPVSSTGHLLLAGHFLGFKSSGKTFEVLIQLGAILAIVTVYSARLWHLARTVHKDGESQRFVFGVLLAFLPAAIIGVMAHGFIKSVLFESPALICTTLLVGGIILLIIDRLPLTPKYTDANTYPLSLCLKIGICQCLAMVPGVSRSGATISGALLLGTDKRSAAEFSFYLALPTMAGAFAYDLYQNRNVISADDVSLIVIGFIAAFVTAVLVVRRLLDFVSQHGFAFFAWWRIAVALVGFAGLYLTS